MTNDLRLAADHQTVTALESPHAAARAAIDVVNALGRQAPRAIDVVSIVRVAAVDDDVAAIEERLEIGKRVVDDGRRHHEPDHARFDQRADERIERARP